jgi:hypothetical protein
MNKFVSNNSIYLYVHVYTTEAIPHMLGTDIIKHTIYFRKCKLGNLESDEIKENRDILENKYEEYIDSNEKYKTFIATKKIRLFNYKKLKEKVLSKILDKYAYENYQIDISVKLEKDCYVIENSEDDSCINLLCFSGLISCCYDIGFFNAKEIKVDLEYNDDALKYLYKIDKLNF